MRCFHHFRQDRLRFSEVGDKAFFADRFRFKIDDSVHGKKEVYKVINITNGYGKYETGLDRVVVKFLRLFGPEDWSDCPVCKKRFIVQAKENMIQEVMHD